MTTLLLVLLTIFLVMLEMRWAFAFSLIFGILFDVFFVNTLGASALKLIFLTLAINLYKRKFNTSHFLFYFLFSLASVFIFRLSKLGLNTSIFKNLDEVYASFFIGASAVIIINKVKRVFTLKNNGYF